MSNYYKYYNRRISQQFGEQRSGLKLVLGGTGLGKTSGIIELIRNLNEKDTNKFIYIANRVQLLEELKAKLPEGSFVHLRRNSEVLADVDLENLLGHTIVKNYVEYFRQKREPCNLAEIRKAYKKAMKALQYQTGDDDEEWISAHTRVVMNFFKKIIREAFKVHSGEIKIEPNLTNQNDYDRLIQHSELITLFPYIEYKRNPAKKILLLTLHKAFYGFFDGRRTVTLFNLDNENGNDNGGRVIFFDEFDFLENDLITLLCQETAIEQPFDFVATFYDRITRNKLPAPDLYSLVLRQTKEKEETVRDRIESIIHKIDELRRKYRIPFPEINHFICLQDKAICEKIETLKRQKNEAKRGEKGKIAEKIRQLEYQKIKSKAVFPTSYTMHKHIYLRINEQREGSFDLCRERTPRSAYPLFNTVYAATADIIRLFKEIEMKYSPRVYQEFERHAFGSNATFKNAIKRIRQIPRRKEDVASSYEAFQYNGFQLYEIQDLQQEWDKDEIVFRYFSLHTTPEKILLHLAQHNLLFGLSATAKIPRLVKNFDSAWLSDELQENFFEPTKEDKADIKEANDIKQFGNQTIEGRQNTITFLEAQTLDAQVPIQKPYYDYIQTLPNVDEDFEDNEYRLRRVDHFFSTLLWIIHNRGPEALETDTHLLFFYTFKQIKSIFEHGINNDDLDCQIITSGEEQNKFFPHYEIEIEHVRFIVVFYNAALARLIKSQQEEEQILECYHRLFWQAKPVIVVTQYASAGNGVNLQYYLTEAGFREKDSSQEKDFKSIHLLDCPYFYFSPINRDEQTEQEKNAVIKANIYYLSKLRESHQISRNYFEHQLENIRNIGQYNLMYLKSPDGILNQLSVFIQAIGRIERVWTKMEDQTIRLSTEVKNIFEKVFCHPEHYGAVIDAIEPYFSHNLKQLVAQIQQNYQERGFEIRELREDIQGKNQENKDVIRRLLHRIKLLREGELNEDRAVKVRKDWNTLRKDALRHNFTSDLFEEYECLFQSRYCYQGTFYINKDNQIVPHDKRRSDFEPWDVNSIYHRILKNDIISEHFRNRNYQLKFDNHGTFFTPYFYQAILAGAIGEEAIKAIFKSEDIKLTDDIDNRLFELADTKIAERSWYIDCKHYSEHTLQNFALKEDDPFYHPKLNDEYFKQSAKKKLCQIQAFHNDEKEKCKLIYINFIGSDERPNRYWDSECINSELDFEHANIIVIQGVVKKEKSEYSTYCDGFRSFVNDLRQCLHQ